MEWDKLLSPERLRISRRRKTAFDLRTEFESDMGRIVFSPALRRMHDKTQVFPLATNDNIHTRLTHSLEVQSLAYSIGVNICNNPAFREFLKVEDSENILRVIPIILSSISLCHDIGNPPFGHFGEHVIACFFEDFFDDKELDLSDYEKLDFLRFDGNAQGFRVLTKLQVLQDIYGLNLSVATLASFLKYPNTSDELNEHNFGKKVGVFQSEKEHLRRIRELTGIGKGQRHPLAYLMEAADSIAYLIMDIEDGYNSNFYSVEEVLSFLNDNERTKPIVDEFDEKFKEDQKHATFKDTNIEVAKMVFLRIFLIGKLVTEACQIFLSNVAQITDGNYEVELIFAEDNNLAYTLQEFTKHKIFSNRKIQLLELTGESVLYGLLEIFVESFIIGVEGRKHKKSEKLFNLISNSIKICACFEQGCEMELDKYSTYFKLRVIVDYISGMTDNYALNLYRQLKGVKIG